MIKIISGFFGGILSALIMFMMSSVFPIIVILIFLYLIVRLRLPAIKGAYGERIVKSKLQQLGEEYTVFHDVNIPNGERGMTQVDHIVTSRYGLFVIETKHYSGWIFGDEYKPYWTQVIYKRKTKLYNPIRQNYGHVKALLAYIGEGVEADVHSIIAFSPNSTFKFKRNFSTAYVIQFPHLLKTIRNYSEFRLGAETVSEINDKLHNLLITDKNEKKRIKQEHMQSIRKAKISKQSSRKVSAVNSSEISRQHIPISHTDCPNCSGQLTLKTGRYGRFYGCSNFPECRYTENKSEQKRQSV